MSCGCENKRMATEEERIRKLAKAYAIAEQVTVGMFKKDDGTWDFAVAAERENIVEYITPY